MQLDRIEAAKARAAERAAAGANADEPAPAGADESAPAHSPEAAAEGIDGSEGDAVARDAATAVAGAVNAPKMSDASQNETEADES